MVSIKYTPSYLLLAVLIMLFIFVGLPERSISAEEAIKQQKNPYANAEITIKIIPSGMTFSYMGGH